MKKTLEKFLNIKKPIHIENPDKENIPIFTQLVTNVYAVDQKNLSKLSHK